MASSGRSDRKYVYLLAIMDVRISKNMRYAIRELFRADEM